jgi:hypothetical protein
MTAPAKPVRRKSERGQAFAETALMAPVMILLIGGMLFAAFFAFRAAAADWGVFITGVAGGSYNHPATGVARQSVMWPDIRESLATGQSAEREVRSRIVIEKTNPWLLGINLFEAQRGSSYFRLWRFYPGPGGWDE